MSRLLPQFRRRRSWPPRRRQTRRLVFLIRYIGLVKNECSRYQGEQPWAWPKSRHRCRVAASALNVPGLRRKSMNRALPSFLLSIALAAPGCRPLRRTRRQAPPPAQSGPAPGEKPSPAELKKHETTPGGKYVPSLDVLQTNAGRATRRQAWGAATHGGRIQVTPTRSTSSGAPAVTVCCVTAPRASR